VGGLQVLFADGHEVLGASVTIHMPSAASREVAMAHDVNDRWTAVVEFDGPGPAHFAVRAWRDLFATWARDTAKKIAAGQSVAVEIEEARGLLKGLRAKGEDAAALKSLRAAVKGAEAQDALMSDGTAALMARIGPRANVTVSKDMPVWVDREAAAFAAWYELFPRSWGGEGQHGTFRDVEGHLDYVTGMGFDTLYFPPIHPIGTKNR
ncbi:MAG: maltotransferase domain-containing protein, partial [Pseudomonadota bacterium]